MVDVGTVRQIASALPEVEDTSGEAALSFRVRGKAFAWTWLERAEPKSARRPRLDVLAVRCPAEHKDAILAADPELFVADPHYDGYPAVLVRLDVVDVETLRGLLGSAWRCQAPPALARRLRPPDQPERKI